MYEGFSFLIQFTCFGYTTGLIKDIRSKSGIFITRIMLYSSLLSSCGVFVEAQATFDGFILPYKFVIDNNIRERILVQLVQNFF